MEKKKYKANRDRYLYELYAVDSIYGNLQGKFTSKYPSKKDAQKDLVAAKNALNRVNGNHMSNYYVASHRINNYKSKRSFAPKKSYSFNRLDTKLVSSNLYNKFGNKK